jgi:endonuclease YncB( thermonuclease family)
VRLLGLALVVAVFLAAGNVSHEERSTVERVVDADTFVIIGGDRVRVLGIDACEARDPGGSAASAVARDLLTGQMVTLHAQPGAPDRDRFGRLLRYVQLPDGRDLGEVLVPRRDVGIYRDGGDASPEYVARLRAVDDPPRVCA